MQRYTQVKAAAAEDDAALALVCRCGLFRLGGAVVRWLDAADVRLKRRPTSRAGGGVDVPLETSTSMEVLASALDLRQVSKVYWLSLIGVFDVDLFVSRRAGCGLGPSGSRQGSS